MPLIWCSISAHGYGHAGFHRTWDARLAEEVGEMTRHRPDLILSDISYLAIAAGARAGLPTAALVSLSWDAVLEFFSGRTHPHARLIEDIRGAYRLTQLAIGLMPAL